MFRLRLPATSANLGPGFDALGLAMGLWLEVRAQAAEEWTLSATGRDAAVVGSLKRNLMVDTYLELAPAGPALALAVKNEIPLGMGCGSSAAALLAGVMLANEFGGRGMSREEMLAEACRREGHPDNVAACLCGGMTASAMGADGRVMTATFGRGLGWRLLLALPREGLATSKARALLPENYRREDAVRNVQATAMVVAAFAQGRGELLRASGWDRLHQPYRGEACPLLPLLAPLVNDDAVYAVTLSGAGPAVLMILREDVEIAGQILRVRQAVGQGALEVLPVAIVGGVEVGQVLPGPLQL